jgi:fructose/tagatose bisphosphate aldolase
VRKFNVNTEVRAAYVDAIKNGSGDLVDVMRSAEAAMQAIVAQKLALFGSSGRAPPQ